MGVRGLHTFIASNVDAATSLDLRQYHRDSLQQHLRNGKQPPFLSNWDYLSVTLCLRIVHVVISMLLQDSTPGLDIFFFNISYWEKIRELDLILEDP